VIDKKAPRQAPAPVTSPPAAADSRTSRRFGAVLLLVAGALAAAAAPSFRAMHRPDPIVAGPGVTAERWLSSWLPALAGGPGDTPVYVFDSGRPGGTALVLGGTHGDEAAGYLAAVLLVERARVADGRLIVIPRANASGFTHNVGQEGHPSSFTIDTPGGPRRFTYGARATNPVHQWPDPQVYTHRASGQTLSGSETRNLNRAYPGRADGSLTERIAFAISELIRRERADIAIDLHEASPEYPVVNTIVAHERAMDLAALANVNLQAAGIPIGLETSPAGLHGLSHREWGDGTPALALLLETTGPSQGRLRGRTDEALVTGGRDRFYVLAAARGRLSVPFEEAGWPLHLRVARHLAGVRELLGVAGDLEPARAVRLLGLPSYAEVVESGLGRYLQPPPSGRSSP
jgi:predicted deacylase